MSLEESTSEKLEDDRAVQAARDTVVQEFDEGYKVLGGPDAPVSHQHDIDRIPRKDVTQEMLSNSTDNPESWLIFGGNYEEHRHTTADVITPENVDNLELEYELSVGNGSSMEGTPIVVPGDPPIMYQTNGPNHMKAIDAREGEVLWSYTHSVPDDALLCCDDNTRGAAVYEDKVFMCTLDSGMVALDRYAGEKEWYHSTADYTAGYSATWAPIAANGMVFTGSAGGEYGIRGFFTAIDADSGEEVWHAWTSPDEEWIGEGRVEESCGTVWMNATLDTERGKLYCPVGNPGPDLDGTVRPGPNRNTCGTLCLDIETGEREWFYQTSSHDIWDYDSSAPRMVLRDVEVSDTAEVEGDTTDLVVGASKTGMAYMMNPDTGKLIERSDPGTQQLNMFKMIPHMDEPRRLPFVPGVMGGNDWQPPSYNPETGLCYFKMQNDPSEARWEEEENVQGTAWWGGDYYAEPNAREAPEGWNGHTSCVVAIDPATGERVWRDWIDSEQYLWGGSMTTASGLTFLGTQNGNMVAYDGESGEHLWEFDAGEAPISGDPMSWYDPETEKQYVAIQMGGSGWLRTGQRDDRLLVFSMEE
jgi:alcohol dehydrogenase (cytochrome c)